MRAELNEVLTRSVPLWPDCLGPLVRQQVGVFMDSGAPLSEDEGWDLCLGEDECNDSRSA